MNEVKNEVNQAFLMLETLGAELEKIPKLQAKLASTGQTVRPFPQSKSNNPIEQLLEARKEVAMLENLIARAPVTATATPPVTANTDTVVAQENLTDQEIVSRLTWTDKCRLAQGKLSVEEARAKIAGPAKGPTLTEQCRAAKTQK